MEFALVAPLLVLFLFAIIEFGSLYMQNLDVRHGAREGARLAAVDADDIVGETKKRMPAADGAEVWLRMSGPEQGQVARVCVEQPYEQLTGLLSFALDGVRLRSQADMRIEQDATWSETGGAPDWCQAP